MIETEVRYKKTGIDWMPEVPEDWTVVKLKYIGEAIIGLTYSPTEIVYEGQGTLVLRASNIQEGEFSTTDSVFIKKEIPLKLITKKGDILLCARNGSVALVGKNIIIDEATEGKAFGAFMTVYRSEYNNYLKHFFNSQIFKAQSSSFATTTVNQLTHHILMNMQVAIPSNEIEKQNIISFLDTQSTKIAHFIQTKQRFIELLKEQRQSIIDESLNIDAKKIRLKFCVSKVGSGVTPKGGASVYQTSGVVFLRSQNIHDDGLRLDDVAYITEKIHSEMSSSQVRPGDVLLNITGASIGRCFWFNSENEANVNQHVSIIRPIFEMLDSEFLMYQIQSQRIQHLINTVQGASREGLTIHEIKNYPLLIPSIEEQKRIVEHIKTETRALDIAISKAEREIELIKEYREAMIAEAVTGKMKL